MLKSPASIGVLIMWGFINICVLCLLHFHSHNNLNQQDLLNTKVQLLKLKRNRDIILLKSSQVDFMRTTMWFGKEDSSINITTIISPSCKHCRQVVFTLLSILEKGIEFRWNIMLGERTDQDLEKIQQWILEYVSDKDKFSQDLKLWSNERIQNLQYSSNSFINDNKVSDICKDFQKQIKHLNILGFPQIILNDRLLSTIYRTEDLEYIIKDLTQGNQ